MAHNAGLIAQQQNILREIQQQYNGIRVDIDLSED